MKVDVLLNELMAITMGGNSQSREPYQLLRAVFQKFQ